MYIEARGSTVPISILFSVSSHKCEEEVLNHFNYYYYYILILLSAEFFSIKSAIVTEVLIFGTCRLEKFWSVVDHFELEGTTP